MKKPPPRRKFKKGDVVYFRGVVAGHASMPYGEQVMVHAAEIVNGRVEIDERVCLYMDEAQLMSKQDVAERVLARKGKR